MSPVVGMPPGLDRVQIRAGVLSNDSGRQTATAINVLDLDGAALAHGVSVSPYVGTNSYVRIERGDDGLGTVKISINAYVEVEP
jgi:hypothetical protein